MPCCPNCDSSAVIYDEIRGEHICTRCGLVLVERQTVSDPDWHADPEGQAGRADIGTGLDITQHDWGLGTQLGESDDLSPAWRARLRRLRKWQNRFRAATYQEKSLRQALIDLDKLCEDLRVPKGIQAEVSSLYRKARSKRLTNGRNTWSVLACLIYLVSRQLGVPRTEKEVSHHLAIRAKLDENKARREIRRAAKVLSRELKLRAPPPKPEDYLARFGSELGLQRRTIARAHELCNSVPEKLVRSKAASVIAATLIYIAARESGERITAREITKAIGVGASTISKTMRDLRELTDGG